MDKVCTIYLVRHAQSLANLNGIIGGDYGLTGLGVEQALEVGHKLKNEDFSAVFSSDKLRAEQTAINIIKGKDIKVERVSDLRERSFGSIENKSNKEYLHLFDALKDMSDEDSWKWKIVDDMETAEEAVERFEKALRKISNTYIGKKVLVVSHGNTIRSFLVKLGFAKFKQLHGNSIPNASYVILEFDGNKFKIENVSGIIKN